jgi:hypothetical protein
MEKNIGRAVLRSHKLVEKDDFQFNEDVQSDRAETLRLSHTVHMHVCLL